MISCKCNYLYKKKAEFIAPLVFYRFVALNLYLSPVELE